MAARMVDPADTLAIMVIGSAPLYVTMIYCHNRSDLASCFDDRQRSSAEAARLRRARNGSSGRAIGLRHQEVGPRFDPVLLDDLRGANLSKSRSAGAGGARAGPLRAAGPAPAPELRHHAARRGRSSLVANRRG